MRISVLTMFPEAFGDFGRSALVSRARQAGALDWNVVDIRDYTQGCYRKIDDSPYGGGAGLIIRCQPVLDALKALRQTGKPHVIALAPIGTLYRQEDARRLSRMEDIAMICGHFEGMDARIYDHADEILSIGDYVLTGGELPAMVVADSLLRLSEAGIRRESLAEESFTGGLLEYPQYTRPAEYEGQRVPEVLLSGNHEAIRAWRQEESLRLTRLRRPDLLEKRPDSPSR